MTNQRDRIYASRLLLPGEQLLDRRHHIPEEGELGEHQDQDEDDEKETNRPCEEGDDAAVVQYQRPAQVLIGHVPQDDAKQDEGQPMEYIGAVLRVCGWHIAKPL